MVVGIKQGGKVGIRGRSEVVELQEVVLVAPLADMAGTHPAAHNYVPEKQLQIVAAIKIYFVITVYLFWALLTFCR